MAKHRKKASQIRAIFANVNEAGKEKLAAEIRSGKVKVIGGKKALGSAFRGKTKAQIKKAADKKLRRSGRTRRVRV